MNLNARRRLNHLNDRQVEDAGEFVVAAVVRRHGHDGTRAVGHQHIIGNPDRDRPSIDGIDGEGAGEYAGFLVGLGAFLLAEIFRAIDVDAHGGGLFGSGEFIDQGMLRREHHVSGAEQRIGPRGVNGEISAGAGNGETHVGALRAANPVALHSLHALGPVEPIEILEQAIGVGGDFQHPLFHQPPFDGIAGLDIFAVPHFFVREHGALRRAPVDGDLREIGEAILVELQKNPLRPSDVVWIGRRNLAAPVVGKPEPFDLAAKGVDVFLRGDGGVHPCAHGVAFRRQPKGVPAHRMQHVEAAHALVAAEDVGRGVALGMADVQTLAGGIGEHVEDVKFRFRLVHFDAESLVFIPVLLPLRFDMPGIVGQGLLRLRESPRLRHSTKSSNAASRTRWLDRHSPDGHRYERKSGRICEF